MRTIRFSFGWVARLRTFLSVVSLCAYRAAEEGLRNAITHSRGHEVSLKVTTTADRLYVEVRDDGQGFDSARVRQGLGLMSLRERLAAVEGALEVTSTPGKGTWLMAWMRLKLTSASDAMSTGNLLEA